MESCYFLWLLTEIISFFKQDFIYLFILREGRRVGEGEEGRETEMCEGNIDQMPLVRP